MIKVHFRALILAGALISSVLFAFSLTGCHSDTVADPFHGFAGDITVKCALNVQGAVSEIEFSRTAGEIKAVFDKPNTLQGFILSKKDGVFYISYGDISADIDESAALILNLCSEAFAPHYSEMTVIKSEERGGNKLTVIESGGFIYLFSKEGVPLSVSGVFDGRQFEISIASIAPLISETEGNAE